jgi:transposase
MGISRLQRKTPEMNAATVAVDQAKSMFQPALADSNWTVIDTHRLTPAQIERWFQSRKVAYRS